MLVSVQAVFGAKVEWYRHGRNVLARDSGLVQERPDLLTNGISRSTGFAQSVAHLIHRCGKKVPFQGVQQRRQLG